LQAALEPDTDDKPIKAPSASKNRALPDSEGAVQDRRGHIEEKYITRGHKQHGPYLYLRYWEDGKLRSKYLGKKKSE
jgi:hypothetical protein